MTQVGDTIYRFDQNRRVYDKSRLNGKIIYSEHFVPEAITGETAQSWLIHDAHNDVRWRVNKKTMRTAAKGGWFGYAFFTAEGMSDDIWRNDHRHKIVSMMSQATTAQLRQIADVLGYDEKDTAK